MHFGDNDRGYVESSSSVRQLEQREMSFGSAVFWLAKRDLARVEMHEVTDCLDPL